MTSLLTLTDVSMVFDGFQALKGVSFDIPTRSITAIIGPNGAGKTTLFNVITGLHPPTRGQVKLRGTDSRRAKAHDLARQGMQRSFQRTSVFPELSVRDNVAAALLVRAGEVWSLWRKPDPKHAAAADELLALMDLGNRAEEQARNLSHGEQKVLDLALALALDPEILLLDEPTAGMASEDTRRTIALIERLYRSKSFTILFTEHDMEVVFQIAERILVLHHGEIIADGAPQDVRRDPHVKRVYLGERG
jgi:branched-chain amino acid transport system ATP-binding protein